MQNILFKLKVTILMIYMLGVVLLVITTHNLMVSAKMDGGSTEIALVNHLEREGYTESDYELIDIPNGIAPEITSFHEDSSTARPLTLKFQYKAVTFKEEPEVRYYYRWVKPNDYNNEDGKKVIQLPVLTSEEDEHKEIVSVEKN